jgi:Ca-activated chloride channel homolog
VETGTRAGTKSKPPRWRKLAPVWLVGLVVLVGVLLQILALQSDDGSCEIPQELVVLTTPTKEARVRELAVAFSDEKQERCRESSVTVFSVPSSGTVADALVGRWPRDDLAQLGPEPAVWMPDATADLEWVNQRLGDDLKSLGSIATSPVVLAVPESAMARVGEDRTVPWRTMLGWARRPASGSRLRIGRPDPSSSTAGLLATIGLNGWSDGPPTPPSRHAVEQAIDPAADELTELCQLAEPGGPARAVLVSEQVMVDHNNGRLGGSCDAREGRPERLTAVYAADGTPVLDHPFVLLPAAAAPEDRAQLARRFFAYLSRPDVQARLRDFGFRDAARNVGGSVGAVDGVLVHDPPAWAEPLDGPTLDQEVDAWEKARLPARALLAMDVSGSMSEELPGPGGRRITAARAAAKRAVGLMGDKDQIGLWRFSQSLDGPRDYQELVPLGPAGIRGGGGRGRDQVAETLDGLLATTKDTGLYDTIHAGIGELRAGGGPADTVDALIVVTDGKNDDRNGGVGLGDVVNRLQDGEDVLVFLLTFGPARCDGGELETLTTGQPDRVRCLDGDRLGLERAFEQVAATLWGTGRPAAGGAGVKP